MLYSSDGKKNSLDVRNDRIAAGTIGADHVVQNTLTNRQQRTFIDDRDEFYRPKYWMNIVEADGKIVSKADGSNAGFIGNRNTPFDMAGTFTRFGASQGMSIVFDGSTLGIIARETSLSGNLRVYIDGVETKGRTNKYVTTSIVGTTIVPTQTTIPLVTQPTISSPLSTTGGTIMVDDEIISYTSYDGSSLFGCTRGLAPGGPPAYHDYTAPLYEWSSRPRLFSIESTGGVSDIGRQSQTVWYNPFLSPGSHEVVIVGHNDYGTAYSDCYFDAFTLGGMLGADNIVTAPQWIRVTGTSSAAGYAGLGVYSSVFSFNDIRAIAPIGLDQRVPDVAFGSANTMFKLGVVTLGDGTYYYYLANGPASSAFDVVVHMNYLGASTA